MPRRMTGAPVICLYVFDEHAGCASARRRGALVAGAIAAGPANKPRGDRLARWCCARPGGRRSSPIWRARPMPAAVFWNEIAQAPHQAVADQVAAALEAIGVASQSFPGDLLVAPSDIRNKDGRGLRVFTPFWRRVQASGRSAASRCRRRTACVPYRTSPAMRSRAGVSSRRVRTGPADCARPGRRARHSAQDRLSAFLESGVAGYATERDRPDREGTSRLSPHLRFGEISPRQVWHAARFAAAERPALAGDIDKFLSELGWREFCRHLLFDVPDLADAQPAALVRRVSVAALTTRRCGRGSAAGPAIPSSMPGCASSGTPA